MYIFKVFRRNKMNTRSLDMLSREKYIVTQHNDFANAFGNLTSRQQDILDYLFSFVKKEDDPSTVYTTSIIEISTFLHKIKLTKNDINNYKTPKKYRPSKLTYEGYYKDLDKITSTNIYISENSGTNIMSLTKQPLFLLTKFKFKKNKQNLTSGDISFQFNPAFKNKIFNLTTNFYSIYLRTLLNIKTKYGKILLREYSSHNRAKGDTTPVVIRQTLDEWNKIMRGDKKPLSPGVFKQSILQRACNDLEKHGFKTSITRITGKENLRKAIGYEVTITACLESPTKIIG